MNANEHPTREEDFDLLALGALEGEEKRAIQSHVIVCSACARKLDEARGRVALISFAAPRVEPSPEVKTRLMRQIQAHSRSAVVPRVPASAADTGGFFGGWGTVILVPIAAVLLFATFYLWRQNKQFDEQLAILHATVQQQQGQIKEDLDIASLLADHDTIVVPLTAQPGQPAGTARVAYNAKQGLLVYAGELATAPGDKSYQLWLVPVSGNPISIGVFNPSTGKTSHWLVKVPRGVTPKAFAVTLEPVGGMTQPTGPKVLIGPVS